MATTKFEKPVGSETFQLQQQVSTMNTSLNALTTKVGNVGSTDLQTQVNTLNSKFITRNIAPETAKTIAKNTNGYVDIDASYSGYTPIGILAINASEGGSAQNWLILWSYQISNNTIRFSYKNTNETSDATVLPIATVLYRRN